MTNDTDNIVFRAIGQVWSDSGESVVHLHDARKLFARAVPQDAERDALQLLWENGAIDFDLNDPTWAVIQVDGARIWMKRFAPGKLEEICRAAIRSENIGKSLRDFAGSLKVPEVWAYVAFQELQHFGCIVALSMPFYESAVVHVSATARRAFAA